MRHTLVGLALDIIDWVLIGFIPGLGDVVDALGAIYFYKQLGIVGALPIVEVIPGFDILPTNTAMGIYADYFAKKEKN